jgi:hypothetical protein
VETILEMIEPLTMEEKYHLVQEMVRSPEWVNLVLKAIATQMSGNP